MVILDFVYYIIFLFVGSFYVYRVLPQFLNILNASDLLTTAGYTSAEQFMKIVDTMSTDWTSFKIYTVIIALLLFFNYCIFKYLIWKKVQQREQTIKQLVKSIALFAVLNISILLFFTALTFFCYYIFVLESFNIFLFFVLPVLMIYAVNLLHPLFVQTQSFKQTLKAFFEKGIKKIYVFIIPYLLMTIGLIAVMYIVPLLLFLPAAVYTVWYVLVFVMYFTWTKYYIFACINTPEPSIVIQKQKVHKPVIKKKEKKA